MQKHEALWRRYRKTLSVRLRDQLVEIYRPLAQRICDAYLQKLPRCVDAAELQAAADDALLERITKYNPDRGVKFETFASPRIRFALIDRLRAIGGIGKLEWERGRLAQEAANRLAGELGRQPTTEEREALSEVQAWRKGQRRPRTISLDRERCSRDADKSVTEEMLLNVRHVRGHRPAIRKSFFEELLRNLDTEHRIIMWARYRVGRTMKETGEFMGLSESRVSQMHSNALAQIRTRLDAGESFELLASEACG